MSTQSDKMAATDVIDEQIGSLETERESKMKEITGIRGQETTAMAPLVAGNKESIERIRSQKMPERITPELDMRKEQMINHSKSASGLLSLLAVVGGLAVRKSSTAAIKNMTAALQGLHAGNELAYQRNMEEYSQHLKLMEQKTNEEWQAYLAVQNNEKLSMQERVNEMQLIAKQYGNQAIAAEHDYIKILQQIGTLQKAKAEILAKQTSIPDHRTAEQKNYETIAIQGAKSGGISVDAWKQIPGNDYQTLLNTGKLKSPSGGGGKKSRTSLSGQPGPKFSAALAAAKAKPANKGIPDDVIKKALLDAGMKENE